jgi:DNA-directed RNA polymerase subunit RPC12/RpoP
VADEQEENGQEQQSPPEPPEFPDAPILWAVAGEQMGLPYLAGRCPKCSMQMAVSQPRYFACPNCNTWLNVKNVKNRKKAAEATPIAAAVETSKEE